MAAYSLPKRLLHWYAVASAASVLLLICSGGLVTSHEAGMAVPDWPNSFGYNMFLFPVSRWVGGVFFEHTHRLIASGVGLVTIALCVALFVIEDRRWVKTLGIIAVAAVVVQGVLGGLRVAENNPLLGLFHGCLAQSFFALMATIGLVTSRFWQGLERARTSANCRNRNYQSRITNHQSPLGSYLPTLGASRNRNGVCAARARGINATLACRALDPRLSDELRPSVPALGQRRDCANQSAARGRFAAVYVRGSDFVAICASGVGRPYYCWPRFHGYSVIAQPVVLVLPALRDGMDPAGRCPVLPGCMDGFEQ